MPETPNEAPTQTNAGLHFLIVDDDAHVRSILESFVRRLGHRVSHAANIVSSRRMITENHFDVALVDIHLGEENGFELVEEFGDRSPDLVFVVISGEESLDNPVEALRLGSLGYLRKPVRLDAFEKEIRRVVKKRESLLMQLIERANLQQELEGRTREFLVEVGLNIALQKSLIQSLLRLTEFRDNETGSHLRRIAEYCREIAVALRRNPKYAEIIDDLFVNRLVTTSPLHDIGKSGIPDAILQKPGTLTVEEFETMKRHTIIGRDTLEEVRKCSADWSSEIVSMGMDICIAHHEAWDGSGYPYGIKNEDIPLSARIVCLADFYDALSSTRVYRRYALPHEEIRAMILEKRARKFDPDVVDAFMAHENKIIRIRESTVFDSQDN